MCDFRTSINIVDYGFMKSIYDPRYVEMINHLKQIRESKKISQDTVAQHLGIDRTHVTKTETLVRRLDFIELTDWLNALDYDIGDFMRELGFLK